MSPMTFAERMVRVQNVAWSRLPNGNYYVEWTQDGVREFRTFQTAGAAHGLAEWLDTSGQQASVSDIREADRAMHDLEQTVVMISHEEAEKRLDELRELGVPIASKRAAKRSEKRLRQITESVGPAHVRRYVRKR